MTPNTHLIRQHAANHNLSPLPVNGSERNAVLSFQLLRLRVEVDGLNSSRGARWIGRGRGRGRTGTDDLVERSAFQRFDGGGGQGLGSECEQREGKKNFKWTKREK